MSLLDYLSDRRASAARFSGRFRRAFGFMSTHRFYATRFTFLQMVHIQLTTTMCKISILFSKVKCL